MVVDPTSVEQMVIRKWSVTDLDAASGLLEVIARLGEAPPAQLEECFGADYDGPWWPIDLERPVLDGALITFRVRAADVVRYRDALRTRIDAANRRYGEVVVPRELAREAAARAKEEERQRTIAEAQRLLDLDPELDAFDGAPTEPARTRELHEDGLAVRVAARSF